MVKLEKLVLVNFKSFLGRVEVDLSSTAHRGGTLTCIIGPNGSGKSSIADALLFCFGEKDIRAKNLATLIHESMASEIGASASVEADLRNDDGSLLRVIRTVSVQPGGKLTSSEYTTQQTIKDAAKVSAFEVSPTAPLDILGAPKALTRSALVERLRTIGINLDLVDSFICKQQGSFVSHLSGTELLLFIEGLVGTAHLAAAITKQQELFDERTDSALELEESEKDLSGQRALLGPQREAFLSYELERQDFGRNLGCYLGRERALYTVEKFASDRTSDRLDEDMRAETEKQLPATSALKEAQERIGSAEAALKVATTAERAKNRALADEEEKLSSASAEAKAAKRKLEANSRRLIAAETSLASSKAEMEALSEACAAAEVEATRSEGVTRVARQGLTEMLRTVGGKATSVSARLREIRASKDGAQEALAEAERRQQELAKLVEKATAQLCDAKAFGDKAKAAVATARDSYSAIVAQSKEATAREEIERARVASAQKHADDCRRQRHDPAGSSGSFFRQSLAPIISSIAASACIHGFVDELAFAKDGCDVCLNEVMRSAIANVVVVGTRADARALIDAVRAKRIGTVCCDVLDELTEQFPAVNPCPKYLTPLIECLEIQDMKTRPVFQRRLKSWFLCSEIHALETFKALTNVNIVTHAGYMFLGDGELRSSAPQKRHGGHGFRLRGENLSTEKIGRGIVSPEQVLEALKEAETEEKDANMAHGSAVAEKRRCDIMMKSRSSEMDELCIDLAARNQTLRQREKDLLCAKSKFDAATAKVDSQREALNRIHSDLSDARAELARTCAIVGDGFDAEQWLHNEDIAQETLSAAIRNHEISRESLRKTRLDMKASERNQARNEKKHCDAAAAVGDQERLLEDATLSVQKITLKVAAKREAAATASTEAAKTRKCHADAHEYLLECQATAEEGRQRLESLKATYEACARERATIESWGKALAIKEAQLKLLQPTELKDATPRKNECTKFASRARVGAQRAEESVSSGSDSSDFEEPRKLKSASKLDGELTCSDSTLRSLSDSSDSDDDKVLKYGKRRPAKRAAQSVVIKSTLRQRKERGKESETSVGASTHGHDREDATKLTSRPRKERDPSRMKESDALTGTPMVDEVNGNDPVSKAQLIVGTNPASFRESLAVTRAILRNKQVALQKAEDKVDIQALEKDLELQSRQTKLLSDISKMRQLASDALHKKATLEQERFDRLFGSLERINAAFGDSFSELSADGEGDLRYSREPLTLFKEGVTIFAKPARSPWRLASSLSGGQQSTVGLALMFAFQQVYRSPFYLLDEVDASLDAQHAARAGRLMQRRAAAENVQYIAISHRPQLFLHADRMVGTYALPNGSSLCIALDFPALEVGASADSFVPEDAETDSDLRSIIELPENCEMAP